jgi:hypothetical protein
MQGEMGERDDTAGGVAVSPSHLLIVVQILSSSRVLVDRSKLRDPSSLILIKFHPPEPSPPSLQTDNSLLSE